MPINVLQFMLAGYTAQLSHVVMAGMQVTISLLEKAMNESGQRRFLIDGFPRNEENRSSFEKQVGSQCLHARMKPP